MDFNHHYDKVAGNYDELKHADWDEGMVPWLMERFKSKLALAPEDVLLDVGGGTGSALAYLRQLVAPKLDWVNMDPSPKMCEVATKRRDWSCWRAEQITQSRFCSTQTCSTNRTRSCRSTLRTTSKTSSTSSLLTSSPIYQQADNCYFWSPTESAVFPCLQKQRIGSQIQIQILCTMLIA